jgi:hypothetical protein
MDDFRRRWPARFRALFGAHVPPLPHASSWHEHGGGDRRRAREELGRGITALKNDPAADPIEGLLVDVGTI